MGSGAKGRTWEDLDDKRWIVLVPKMEECDLAEEFFYRIRDPLNDDEEEGDFTDDGNQVLGRAGCPK